MALVRCPHCGVDTPDRQVNCYFCHKPRHEKPAPVAPIEDKGPTIAPEPLHKAPAPTPSGPGVPEDQVYRNWWYLFCGLLAFMIIVAGADGEKGPVDFIGYGIIYSLMVAIFALMACGPLVWLIRLVTGTRWHALAPAVASGLVLIAVLAGLGGHFFKGGGDDCIDSGRYGEYSSC